tara:strand:+ start:2213 stop:2485 length:273 start_codon:yes stop_codon:yes gene_type:complete
MPTFKELQDNVGTIFPIWRQAQVGHLLTEHERLEKENQALKLMLIDNGICPFGAIEPGAPMGTCPSGFPGCACADELLNDPRLLTSLRGK